MQVRTNNERLTPALGSEEEGDAPAPPPPLPGDGDDDALQSEEGQHLTPLTWQVQGGHAWCDNDAQQPEEGQHLRPLTWQVHLESAGSAWTRADKHVYSLAQVCTASLSASPLVCRQRSSLLYKGLVSSRASTTDTVLIGVNGERMNLEGRWRVGGSEAW